MAKHSLFEAIMLTMTVVVAVSTTNPVRLPQTMVAR